MKSLKVIAIIALALNSSIYCMHPAAQTGQHKSDVEVLAAAPQPAQFADAHAAATAHPPARIITRRASDPGLYKSLEDPNFVNEFSASPVSGSAVNLHDAAQAGDIPALQEILHKYPEMINERDSEGNTLLHCAVDGNQEAATAYLLTLNPDMDAQNEAEMTPAMSAVITNNPRIMIQLLAKNPRLEITTTKGFNALNTAQIVIEQGGIMLKENQTNEQALKDNETIQRLLFNQLQSNQLAEELRAALKRVSPEQKQMSAASPAPTAAEPKLTVQQKAEINRQQREKRKLARILRRKEEVERLAQLEKAAKETKKRTSAQVTLNAITTTEVIIHGGMRRTARSKKPKPQTLSSIERARRLAAQEREKKEKERLEKASHNKGASADKKRVSPPMLSAVRLQRDAIMLRPILPATAPQAPAKQIAPSAAAAGILACADAAGVSNAKMQYENALEAKPLIAALQSVAELRAPAEPVQVTVLAPMNAIVADDPTLARPTAQRPAIRRRLPVFIELATREDNAH